MALLAVAPLRSLLALETSRVSSRMLLNYYIAQLHSCTAADVAVAPAGLFVCLSACRWTLGSTMGKMPRRLAAAASGPRVRCCPGGGLLMRHVQSLRVGATTTAA